MNDKTRLPTNAVPANYELFLDIDIKKFTFSGKEKIELKIRKPTKNIILNSSGLKINSAAIFYKGKRMLAKVAENKKLEQISLEFSNYIGLGAELAVEFEGKMNDSLVGLYRSKYFANGKEKYLATTQLESHYARRMFPCFDEPGYKATFDVTVKIDKNLEAISNMPVKEEKIENNKKTVAFQKTPKMSTYLLYLAAGEFEFLEQRSGKVLIRVATTPGKKNQAKFALNMTKRFLKYFEKYSGIAYPLPKLDMIAIPDFASGAMENWGAITFREVLLLFDPKVTSMSVKKRIAEVIAHELWHQWSGNLVTMEWWDDLWLNESFATFMAYKAVDNFFPEWEYWKDFVLSETDVAFDADSIKNTHPIEAKVRNPNEISEIFDTISYNKGGSVLRMIENYIGPGNFRKGVGKYLKLHKYGNATASDLWNSLSSASKLPVRKLAAAWIQQPGYPLVTATINKNNLHLSQKRFIFGSKDKTVWPVPITIKTEKRVFTDMLEKREKKIAMKDKWFKANYGQTGFYRVKYDDSNLSKLKCAAACKNLPSIDRWGIQSDLFRLCRHNEATIGKYIDFIKAYRNENDYTVLRSVFGSMQSVYFVFSREKLWNGVEHKFMSMFEETFSKILDRIGWEPKPKEKERDSQMRNLALGYLGFAGHKKTIEMTRKKFDSYCNGKPLHPNMRGITFSIVSDSADETVYKRLLRMYKKSQSPEEKVQILNALGNFRDPRILKKALDFSISKDVRKQDMYSTFSSASANPFARSILIEWADKNWKQLEAYKHHSIFFHILESLITAFVTKDKESELKEFFKRHPVEYSMVVSKSFDRMKRNISWLENNRKSLENYFS